MKKKYLWPDRHYGLNNRKLFAENRGELHLGEESVKNHAEYIVSDAPMEDMLGQQSTKNPEKGNSKG